MKRRIFALLLVVALLVGIVPSSVLAFDCDHSNATTLFNNPASCGFDGSAFYRCNDCGHTWLETTPATGEHVYENGTCTGCGAWEPVPEETEHVHAWTEYAAVEPGCETEGNIAYKQCQTCGEAQTAGENPIPLGRYGWILGATGHNLVTVQEIPATCVEHGYVQQECTNCDYDHNWSPEPTNIHIVENGKCALCGREMAQFNCEHTNETILGQDAATCTMEGYKLHQCNDCRLTWREVLPVIAHAYVDGVCGNCGTVCAEHDYVTIFEKEPTCVEHGYVQQVCTICGYEHNWSPDPSNIHIVENGKCALCGREMAQFNCEHTNAIIEGQEAATCTMEGWILHKCQDCRLTWTEILPVVPHAYENGACTICGAVCAEHNYVTVKEVEPTCVEHGYVAQKCTICGYEHNWSPEPTNIHIAENGKCVLCGREMAEFNCDHSNNTILGQEASTCEMEGWILYQCNDCRLTWLETLAPHAWNVYEAVAPSCNAEGNIAYKICSVCGEAWTLGENPMPLTKFGWVLGPTGEHTMEKYEAVAATCDTDGHEAFEYCTTCECFFYEDALKLTYQAGVIPALGHAWVEHEAVAPSCNAEGNIAYAQCSTCGAAQTLGENPIPLGLYGWVLGPTGAHTFEHHDAIEATCDTDGHEAFDYCTTCECFFYEDALKLTYQAGIILATGHTWVEYEAVAPTCDTEGNVAYAQCSVCGAAQTLGENPMPLSMYGWILGATGHTWVEYEAVAPTCDTEGNMAYAQCSVCGAAQTLGENPLPLSKYGWILGATGHTWVEHEAVEPTCDLPGNIAYAQCSVCGAAQTLGENPAPLGKDRWVLAPVHSIKHVEAKAATTEAEGNVEYWYCEDCGYAWLDEAMTQVTNLKSVITPKLPKAETPATGDATPVVALIVLAVAAIFGLALVMINKKKFSV